MKQPQAESATVPFPESVRNQALHGMHWGLAIIIFIAPLFMGGRHPLGKLVFVALVVATALCWVIGQCCTSQSPWRRSGIEPLLILGGSLVVLQLVGLSPEWLGRLSPALERFLPLWFNSDAPLHLGNWTNLSLDPQATRGGLVMYLAIASLFLIVIQYTHRIGDVERILRWISIAVIGMAILGLAQYLCGNGKFLWTYAHPFRHTSDAVKGSFANENHFAHFIALGIGPLLWWLWSTTRTTQDTRTHPPRATGPSQRKLSTVRNALPLIQVVSAGLVFLAGLLTFSRGGILILVVSCLVIFAIYSIQSLIGKRELLVLGAIVSMVIVALAMHGHSTIIHQLQSLRISSVHDLSAALGREDIWSADMTASRNYLITGTGIGSHRQVYPTFFSAPSEVEFTHAENGYLQILMEAGIPGLTLVLIGLFITFRWLVLSLNRSVSAPIRACAGAILAGMVITTLHAVVDFAWYIPTCMSYTVILAACACRLATFARCSETRPQNLVMLPRTVWIALFLTATVSGTIMVCNRWGPAKAAIVWDRYLAHSQTRDHEADFSSSFMASSLDHQRALAETVHLQSLLRQVLEADPHDPRAHARMAALYLRRFEIEQHDSDNAMGLAPIRDAALTSDFPNHRSMLEWVDRAIGENKKLLELAQWHATRSVMLCPLQGDAYLFLAELAFLRNASPEYHTALLNQALQVRPYHGAVLFAAGREAALQGDLELALQHWKSAFHRSKEYQKSIVESLADQIPPLFLVSVFQPDWEGLGHIYRHYHDTGQAQKANEIAPYYLQAMKNQAQQETGPTAAWSWAMAHALHEKINQTDHALVCLRRAVQEDPANYKYRRRLAFSLFANNQLAESTEHLRWCLRRQPSDQDVQHLLKKAHKHHRVSVPSEKTAQRTSPTKR